MGGEVLAGVEVVKEVGVEMVYRGSVEANCWWQSSLIVHDSAFGLVVVVTWWVSSQPQGMLFENLFDNNYPFFGLVCLDLQKHRTFAIKGNGYTIFWGVFVHHNLWNADSHLGVYRGKGWYSLAPRRNLGEILSVTGADLPGLGGTSTVIALRSFLACSDPVCIRPGACSVQTEGCGGTTVSSNRCVND